MGNRQTKSNQKRKKDNDSNQETKKLPLFEWFDAVKEGKIEVVEKYLKNGWDVNTGGAIGWDFEIRGEETTALHVAVKNGHIDIVKLLLEHGAHVNIKINLWWWGEFFKTLTALHLAVEEGHIEIVKLLLEHGADVNIKDSNGVTALDLAKRRGDIKMFGFIRQWMEEKEGLDPNT